MIKAFGCCDGIENSRGLKELEACLLEAMTPVLLGQSQYDSHGGHVDMPAKSVLAYQLQPLHAVPVRRNKQMLTDHSFLLPCHVLRQGIGVHEL